MTKSEIRGNGTRTKFCCWKYPSNWEHRFYKTLQKIDKYWITLTFEIQAKDVTIKLEIEDTSPEFRHFKLWCFTSLTIITT